TYAWSIDNGAITLTGATPTLTAAQVSALGAGPHNVSLTVTDSFGATAPASTTLTIYNNVPTASFAVTPNPGACNVPLNFDGSASRAGRPDRSITKYNWSFGDGAGNTGSTSL